MSAARPRIWIGRAHNARCRSNSSNPIRAIRAANSPMPNSASSPNSIKQHGVIQPIVVRPVRGAQDRYEIIAGERRWRASQIAGLHEVPIVPVDVSDSDALEIAIIENVQREDLNAMEEAQGYHALANEFKRSQEDIAKIVGKSRSHVANMMRLTKLPAEVQAYIALGQLSAGHARALDRRSRSRCRGQTDRRGRPQCPSGRGAGACRGRARTQAAKGAWRQGEGSRYGRAGENASAMRSGSRSASITAIPAAPCTSATATSISSTRSCEGWARRLDRSFRGARRREPGISRQQLLDSGVVRFAPGPEKRHLIPAASRSPRSIAARAAR